MARRAREYLTVMLAASPIKSRCVTSNIDGYDSEMGIPTNGKTALVAGSTDLARQLTPLP